MSESTVKIWRDMLKQGVFPENILIQVRPHKRALYKLPESEERDEAINATDAFIGELISLIRKEKDESSKIF